MDVTTILNRYKNSFFGIALILLAVIISNKIYKAQDKKILLLQAQAQEEFKKNEVLREISSLERKIMLYNKLLEKKDPASAINSIGNIARDSGVKIISIKPGQELKFSDYIKMPLELTVNVSNYHTLGKFISMVESQKDLYLVDSMSISAGSQSEGLSVNLRISSIILTK